ERVAELVRELRDRRVDLPLLDRLGGIVARAAAEHGLVGELDGRRTALLGTELADQRIAERPQQVADLVVPTEHPRAGQHAGIGLLHEVLRLFPRSRPRTGGPVEARELLDGAIRVEAARSPHQRREGIAGCMRRTWVKTKLRRFMR